LEQIPSIGRIVHYQDFGTPDGKTMSLVRAAIITQVYGTQELGGHEFVGLCVLAPEGMFFRKTVVYDAEGKPGSWRWPPRV
jgi:hypothetical protein